MRQMMDSFTQTSDQSPKTLSLSVYIYRVYMFPQLAGQTRLSGHTRLVDYRAPRLHCPSSRIRLASLLTRAGQIWPIPTMLREYYGASSFILPFHVPHFLLYFRHCNIPTYQQLSTIYQQKYWILSGDIERLREWYSTNRNELYMMNHS